MKVYILTRHESMGGEGHTSIVGVYSNPNDAEKVIMDRVDQDGDIPEQFDVFSKEVQ